jgi:hypothetical protein
MCFLGLLMFSCEVIPQDNLIVAAAAAAASDARSQNNSSIAAAAAARRPKLKRATIESVKYGYMWIGSDAATIEAFVRICFGDLYQQFDWAAIGDTSQDEDMLELRRLTLDMPLADIIHGGLAGKIMYYSDKNGVIVIDRIEL